MKRFFSGRSAVNQKEPFLKVKKTGMREEKNQWLVLIVGLVFVLVGVLGCGDESLSQEEGNVGDPSQEETNQGDPSAGVGEEEECEEGEEINPFTGVCVPADQGGEDDGEGDQSGDDANGDGGGAPNPGDCGPGALHGQVCTTDGTRLPAAEVTISGLDCSGVPFSRIGETDGNGVFFIDNIPSGHHEMRVSSGSFSAERNVDIFNGQVNDTLLSEGDKVCVGGDVKILVVSGSFDTLTNVLDRLDLDYTENVNNTELTYLLSNPVDLLEYDILFFPCGSRFVGLENSGGDMQLMMNNLRNFVEQGNSIYASDWSHEFVRQIFPESMTFHDPPRVGDDQVFAEAQVVSPPMQMLLNSATVELVYNLPGVGQVIEANPPSVVHFRSDVSYDNGSGVLYGVPLMTSYTDPIRGGTVIYTSFHNSAQASGDMEAILNFMIFQL